MKIVVSEQADSDLLQIHGYLAERNPAAAFALADRFHRAFENLTHFPFIGRDRSILINGSRSIIVETYVVFYVVNEQRITIFRVLDGRRDIESVLRR
jgi:toxin ParE1/3/4